jgi:hypothetical protein
LDSIPCATLFSAVLPVDGTIGHQPRPLPHGRRRNTLPLSRDQRLVQIGNAIIGIFQAHSLNPNISCKFFLQNKIYATI